MKRNFYALGLMLAAAFTLTNCTKEFENPSAEPEGVPFEIIASTVDTKTANDGMSTKWVADDAINLFHAVAGTTTYGTNDKFTITSENLAANKFTGELTEGLASGNYDWYALYPYNDKIATPGDKTVGYTYIGYSTGLNQEGYNSMASLKGSVCPLYGVAKAVPADETPDLTMEHLSSVVAIKITNANDEPLTVTTASFTATEDIVGSYFIDITKTPVVYKASDPGYVKNTATVTVISGATPLEKGESATLYLAIKPFKAASGKKLTLSVNGYSKTITLTKDVTFSAGKIKTLNFSYDKEEAPAPEGTTTATLTFDAGKVNRLSYTNSEQVWFQNGITFKNIKSSSTTNIGNYANPVRMYKQSQVVIDAPGNITKIVFNSEPNDSDDAKKYLDFLKTAVGTNTTEGTKVTVQLDGTTSSVTYTMPGQVRLYDITVTYLGEAYVPPTLESIAVSGEYKTEFTQGSEFSFGGVVTATYDDASTRIVTNDCTFTGYDMDVTGNQTVTVTYEGKTCQYTINVKEKPQAGSSKTVTMSSFTAVQGSLDDVISYTTAKGNGTSDPAINSNQIRLYQNSAGKKGGSITITAKSGYKLTSVTIGSGMATSVVYTIGSTDSDKKDIAKNAKLIVTDVNASEITFHCMGTTSTSRLYVNYLSVTYQAD